MQQWRWTECLQNPKGRHVQHSQEGWAWCTLYQCPQSHTYAPTPQKDGPQATQDSHQDWQQHHIWGCQQQHPTARYKGHGHAFPLAMLSRITKLIQVLLVTGNKQPSQLLDQASLRSSPHQKALTPKIILDALRASANRSPATLGKGLIQAINVAPAAWSQINCKPEVLKGCARYNLSLSFAEMLST